MKIVSAVMSPHEWQRVASGVWKCFRCGFVSRWSDDDGPDPYDRVAFLSASGEVMDGGCDEVLANSVMGS